MILITGAGGKTGQAVIRSLRKRGAEIKALVHAQEKTDEMRALGVIDILIGDMRSNSLMDRAMEGIQAVYHICPNMHPDELAIGKVALEAAKSNGVERFVYHSVLHPQVQSMPHHWNKLLVEEAIFSSGMSYTILQPTAYLQNLMAYFPRILADGIYAPPYLDTARISQVDLDDVADVAARVILEPGFDQAIFELVGTPPLSQTEVASEIGDKIKRTVRVECVPREVWEQNARRNGMREFAIQTLLKMFAYYETYGMGGNSTVLTWLLKRTPTNLSQFCDRILASSS